jgi:aubergine
MNCKLAHKVMRQENVLQIISDCMREGGNFQVTAAKKIIGSTVLTDYNNETYKVDDIDWLQNPDSTFETRDGEESFANYYERRYRLKVKDRKQPLLVVKPKARNIRGGQDRLILLVPEFCRATGVTDQMRTNFQLMRDMAQYTRLSPRENVERLNTFNRRLQENPGAQRIFNENRMRLDRQLVQFDGRRLKQEIVYFGNEREVDLKDANADWTRNLQNNMMFKTMPLKNWFYLYPRRSKQSAREFYGVFKQVTDGFRMRVEAPTEIEIEDNNRAYAEALDTIMRNDPQFIMVVVSSNAADRYAAIKRITLCTPDSVKPVSVQVIAERTMKPIKGSVMSIATKVIAVT